jgi:hypothetical protein
MRKANRLGTHERVVAFLHGKPEGATATEVARGTGLNMTTVRRILARHRDGQSVALFFWKTKRQVDPHRMPEQVWKLLS